MSTNISEYRKNVLRPPHFVLKTCVHLLQESRYIIIHHYTNVGMLYAAAGVNTAEDEPLKCIEMR